MKFSAKLRTFKAFVAQAWALAQPYFRSEQKWKAGVLLVSIIALNLAAVYMLVLLNDWYRLFYNALQNKQEAAFWTQLGRFTYLAFAFILIAVYKFYLTQLLEMRWRAWMTDYYLQRWLSNKAFYQLELRRFKPQATAADALPDNPDQRMQEDINLFSSYTISLSMGLLNALVTLASFVGILWNLSGSFSFSLMGENYTIAGFMVWATLIYCALGSVAAHYIGRPLIKLNFEQQRKEADFRHHLVRVREYSEAIALDRGESVERTQLDTRFSSVLQNYLKLIKAKKNLTWFTVGFGQAAVVFPFVVAAPRFFSGAIQLGELMQIASAFGRVQDALSWFVENYDTLARWRATTDRLTSFEAALAGIHNAQPELRIEPAADLQTRNLHVRLPSGESLVAGANLHARAGAAILLQGPSGSGKSTLFRAIAGIWPFAAGAVLRPAQAMFIPQRPYFPNAPLRDALAYPEAPSAYSDSQLRQALQDAGLPQLCNQLDNAQAWGQDLSGGEQQRLAVARVLLKRPQWVFADEATSALDEASEQKIYQQLLALIKETQGGLISIAHRPSVAAFHKQRWEMSQPFPGQSGRFALKVQGAAG